MLVDPCYVLDDNADDRAKYFAVCGAHKVGCDCATHDYQGWHNGVGGETPQGGVVVGSFGGDGAFPVYAHVVNGEVRSVEIRFDIDRDEDEGSIL